jgi:hypothetical protein
MIYVQAMAGDHTDMMLLSSAPVGRDGATLRAVQRRRRLHGPCAAQKHGRQFSGSCRAMMQVQAMAGDHTDTVLPQQEVLLHWWGVMVPRYVQYSGEGDFTDTVLLNIMADNAAAAAAAGPRGCAVCRQRQRHHPCRAAQHYGRQCSGRCSAVRMRRLTWTACCEYFALCHQRQQKQAGEDFNILDPSQTHATSYKCSQWWQPAVLACREWEQQQEGSVLLWCLCFGSRLGLIAAAYHILQECCAAYPSKMAACLVQSSTCTIAQAQKEVQRSGSAQQVLWRMLHMQVHNLPRHGPTVSVAPAGTLALPALPPISSMHLGFGAAASGGDSFCEARPISSAAIKLITAGRRHACPHMRCITLWVWRGVDGHLLL